MGAFLVDPMLFPMIAIGTVFGIAFGSMPGIGNLMAMSLALPFTYAMSPERGMLLLIGIYCGGIYGGSMTAIMFRIPGSSENAASMFDGYPMAKKGQASKAIGTAIVSSVLGGLFSVLVMIFGCSLIAKAALKFGPMEYFFLTIFAFCIIATLGGTSVLKGWISILLGLFLAVVGTASVYGTQRFTFGSEYLASGIDYVPVLIGVFATSELFFRMGFKKPIFDGEKGEEGTIKVRLEFPTAKELWSLKRIFFQSALLGTFFGALPGIGATFSSFTSYALAMKTSKHPERFGTGIIEGVAAPETANNASTGGSMVPLITLGIPGSASTAILLSALMLHGLIPGPTFFFEQIDLVRTIYIGMFLANIFILVFSYFEVGHFLKLMFIPFGILGPLLVSLCVVGTYALRNNIFDVWVMIFSGVLGYFMKRYNYSVVGLTMGVILGSMLESHFFRTYLVYQNDFFSQLFFHRPISLGFFLLSISLFVFFPIIKWVRNRTVSSNE